MPSEQPTEQPKPQKEGRCHVCGDSSPSDFELCGTCQRLANEAEQDRKKDARKRAFGIGSVYAW
ncbi:hypothetical protein M0R72_10585 [Candidatus Pacearchaeota archaeon]|nr:hypothetical protein [Candidatus Pacearchaeota archaeon]